jgi:ribose/xylose/arabinose/galactoside ABC-type transport system permease subunit
MPMSGGSKARFRFAIYGALTLSAITNGLTLWGANGNVQNIVKAGIFIMVLAIGAVFERGKDG